MTETSLGELGRQFKPLAARLKELTEPLSGDSSPIASPVLQLARLTATASGVVAYLLHNMDEGALESARHNLQILHDVTETMVTQTRAALSDCDARTPTLHGRCLAAAHLDDSEREWLRFRPFAANEVPDSLRCELEADHPGPHAANAQLGNGVEWWMHWTLRASEIAEHRGCGADVPDPCPEDPEQRDVCLLYAGHPGRHSFAIGR